MIKKIAITLSALLFISLAALGDSRARSPFGLKGVTTASTPQRTVRVRLVQVETNADLIDSPVADSNINIRAGAASFNGRTNQDGIATFDAVPCGGKIVITVHDESSNEDTVFHRRLTCRGKLVNLGVLTSSFGGKPTLAERVPHYYGYDAVKGVWRDEAGRIVPNRVIRGIRSRP